MSMHEKLTPHLPDEEMPYKEDEVDYLDADDDGHESFHEYSTTQKPYRTPIYKRKRYIVGCLVFTVIFLAIFIPLFLKFALGPIAQSMMNHATMNVIQLNMTDPQEQSMTVSVLATVSNIPKIFSATLEFTQAVEVSWNEVQIGSMTLGTVHVSGGKGSILQTTGFQIVNTTAFGQFAKVMLSAEGFTWTMDSVATVKALGQTIKGLTINKQLNMHGLNNFADVQILGFNLPSDAPDGNGALVSIQASIPNPSPIGMTLGTITLDMFFETAYLGRVVAENVTLVGGQPMAMNLNGQLYKQTDPVHEQELSLLMSNYLANIPTLATGKGVSVFPDGVHAISWLTDAITSTSLTVPLKAVGPMDVIKNIAINDMSLAFSEANPWSPTVTSNSVSADFKIPFNISINVTQLSNTVFKMAYQGTPFVELSTAIWNTSASDMKDNKVVFTVPPSPMNVFDHDAFSAFMTSVTQHPTSIVEITGSAQGVAVTSLGTVQLTVPLNTSLSLQGINFGAQTPSVSNVLVVGGDTDHISINGTVGLYNPSVFSVVMGPVVLKLNCTVNGTLGYLGSTSIPNLALHPGMNEVASTIAFEPTDKAFAAAFLGEFVTGSSFQSFIYGDTNTSPIASVLPTLMTLKMSTTIPGLSPAPLLIKSGNAVPTLGQILGPRVIPMTVDATNPLATSLSINTMTASVLWEGNYFGGVNQAHVPFTVPANSTMTSPPVSVQCPQGYDFALFLVTQFIPKNIGVLTGAVVLVNMTADLAVSIGGPEGVGYAAEIHYSQINIPAFLKVDYTFAGITKRSLQVEGADERHPVLARPVTEISSHSASLGEENVLVSKSVLSPTKIRQILASMDERDLYKNVVALVGEEAPAKESGLAYVAWMEKALRAIYADY